MIESEIDYFNSHSPLYVEPRVLTIVEAIKGIEDEVDFSPLSRKSSPGYPFLFERGGTSGKSLWFGTGQEYEFTSPMWFKLKQQIEEDIVSLSKGILPFYLFVDNLKDELRSKKKIDEGLTRNFCASPQNFTIVWKMYFGTCNIWFLKNRINNGFTVGINPYGPEWTALALCLLEYNWKINAGDFKNFDGSHVPQINQAELAIIESHYVNSTPEERLIRKTLWSTLYQTYHLVDGEILKWQCSLGSGHPFTPMANNLTNRILHKMCFYDACGAFEELLWIFNDEVYIAPHGDDSLMSCFERWAESYNEAKLPEYMIKYGFVYTPETKEVSDGKIRNILEVSYLKRNFRVEPLLNGYAAPMSLVRLKEMVNWTRKENGSLILRDKLQLIASEFSLHGREVFDGLIKRLNEGCFEVFGTRLKKSGFSTLIGETSHMEIVPDVSDLQSNHQQTRESTMTVKTIYQVMAILSYPMAQQPIYVTKGKLHRDDYQVSDDFNVIDNLQMNVEEISSVETPDLNVVDDANANIVSAPRILRANALLGDFSNGDGVSTVLRFLQRPQIHTSGYFTSTDVASTFPNNTWESALLPTVISTKLSGINGFKGDLVITVKFNASSLQQGYMALAFLYSGGLAGGSKANWNLMHRFSKYQISQLPVVYGNLSCDTSMTLKVPWKSTFSSYLYSTGTPTFSSPGDFFLYPIVPVNATTGPLNCPFTMWTHFENITMGTPSIPQMGNRKPIKKDLLSSEQEGKPVSTTLQTLSDAAGIVSSVPGLSSVAGPLSWALSAASKVASSFGFSKPIDIERYNRTVRTIMPYSATYNGTSSSEPLSLDAQNHVSVGEEFLGTDIDEMSVDYIKQIPMIYDVLAWNTTDVAGTALFYYSTSPTGFRKTATDAGLSVTCHSPISWIGQSMNLWRGSVILNITIVGTNIHSGRLLFVFSPCDSSMVLQPTPSTSNSQYSFRTELDIRESDSFEITVPYISAKPWCAGDEVVGVVSLLVLDPLIAPTVVPSTVGIVVTVRGGSDLAYSCPKALTTVPVIPSALQMENSCKVKTSMVGNSNIVDANDVARELTQGESFVSFRQLIKRTSPIFGTTTSYAYTKTYSMLPFRSYLYYSNGAGAVAGAQADISRDLFTHLSSIYAFSRGGVHITYCPTVFTNSSLIMVALDHYGTTVTGQAMQFNNVATLANAAFNSTGNGIVVSNASTGNPGVFVPQNSKFISRASMREIVTAAATTGPSTGADCAVINWTIGGATNTTMLLFRRGADDCSFGCFTSIPPYYTDSAPA